MGSNDIRLEAAATLLSVACGAAAAAVSTGLAGSLQATLILAAMAVVSGVLSMWVALHNGRRHASDSSTEDNDAQTG